MQGFKRRFLGVCGHTFRHTWLFALLGAGCASPPIFHGPYLEGGAAVFHNANTVETATIVHSYNTDALGLPVMTSFGDASVSYAPFDRARVSNPYGLAGIGYQLDWAKWSLDCKVYAHVSGLFIQDRGDEYSGIFLKWFPWGR